jgi:hypothetical protein
MFRGGTFAAGHGMKILLDEFCEFQKSRVWQSWFPKKWVLIAGKTQARARPATHEVPT